MKMANVMERKEMLHVELPEMGDETSVMQNRAASLQEGSFWLAQFAWFPPSLLLRRPQLVWGLSK
jgi:hypothetical protein